MDAGVSPNSYKSALKITLSAYFCKWLLIVSFNHAHALREDIKAIAWDLVVIDEAYKLRNAYRPSNKVGQGIRWATEDCRKLLLTATPLQNSLVELFGLSTLIDEHLFGDLNAFRAQYASAGSSITDLRQRLATFCKRTLRNQVTEYVRYTERRAITRPFTPSEAEHSLYEAVSGFLQRPNSYALPHRQRHLTALILRKLLASSSRAIAGTLDALRVRLETLPSVPMIMRHFAPGSLDPKARKEDHHAHAPDTHRHGGGASPSRTSCAFWRRPTRPPKLAGSAPSCAARVCIRRA